MQETKIINLNLVNQFNLIMKSRLEVMGVTKGFSLDDACFQYLNLRRRLVDPLPRKVHFSKEFHCPDNLKAGLNLVKSKIEKGEDITPHLSGKFKDLNYHDMMLNDWGVHHLHLGTKINRKTGLAKRTGPILYVKFEREDAYFIQIMEHGEWANDEIIKILHNNWPQILDLYLMRGVTEVKPKISNEDRAALRKAGVSTVVEIAKGIVYMPLGGGYSSSGHGTSSVMQSMRAHNQLNRMELYIKENFQKYEDVIREQSSYKGNKFDFILKISDVDNKVHITEVNSGVIFFLGHL